jgi:hypothetical protein
LLKELPKKELLKELPKKRLPNFVFKSDDTLNNILYLCNLINNDKYSIEQQLSFSYNLTCLFVKWIGLTHKSINPLI